MIKQKKVGGRMGGGSTFKTFQAGGECGDGVFLCSLRRFSLLTMMSVLNR